MNLIPDEPCDVPNYWCTWALQNYIYGQDQKTIDFKELEGDVGARHGATNITENLLLKRGGWAQMLYPSIRGDLFLLLDDGWDIPIDTPSDSKSYFSSFDLNELNYSFIKEGDSFPEKDVSLFIDNCRKIFRRRSFGLTLSPKA